MSLTRIADLEEDNDRLRAQLVEIELERDYWRDQARELRAQLGAMHEVDA